MPLFPRDLYFRLSNQSLIGSLFRFITLRFTKSEDNSQSNFAFPYQNRIKNPVMAVDGSIAPKLASQK